MSDKVMDWNMNIFKFSEPRDMLFKTAFKISCHLSHVSSAFPGYVSSIYWVTPGAGIFRFEKTFRSNVSVTVE